MTSTNITTDHDEIMKWAKRYNARPAVIDKVDAGADKVGIRLDFPGEADEEYLDDSDTHAVSWRDFFEVFEQQGLAFTYETELNDPSWAYKFIKRENLDEPDEE